jgi:hypothetical protein
MEMTINDGFLFALGFAAGTFIFRESLRLILYSLLLLVKPKTEKKLVEKLKNLNKE